MGQHRADPDRPGSAFWFTIAGLVVAAVACGVAVYCALAVLNVI